MKKVFKIIGAITGLILFVLLLAVLIVPLLINPNDHKKEIEQMVEQATGRELTINDEIKLTLFPWMGVTVGDMTLANAAGFDEPYFAQIERAEVKLRLLPLLNQRLEMGAVQLHGLQLNLGVTKDGVRNWAGPAKDELAEESNQRGDENVGGLPVNSISVKPATALPAPEEGFGLAAWTISGVQIIDASVTYLDQRNDSRYVIRQLNLTTGPVSMDAPLDITLNSHFEASPMALNGQLNVNTQLQIDRLNERYQFSATTLEATLRGVSLPAGKVAFKLAADITLEMAAQRAELSALTLSSYGVTLSGDVNLERWSADWALQGQFNVAEFNPRTVMSALEMALPKTADANALSRVQLAFSLDGAQDEFRFHQSVLMLDESRIEGEVQVAIVDAPLPAVKYALTIDQLDVDRYLSAKNNEPAVVADESPVNVVPPAAAETSATLVNAGADASPLPLATLRALDLHGTLAVGQLQISGLHLSDIRSEVNASAGVIRLQPLSARLYQGHYQGDMTLDVRGDEPKLSLNESLSQIQVGPLLKDYMDEDKVRGTGNIQAQLAAVGATAEQITQSLNGQVTLAFVDGAMKNVNIVQMVREAKAKIKGQPQPPASTELNETDFAEMKATLDIKQGVVKNSDLSIKSPFLRVGGVGQADLVNETIDYLATAVISKTEQGQGGAELTALRGLSLPVHVRGTFDTPTFKLALGDVLKAQAGEALAKEKRKLKAKLEQLKAEDRARLQQKLDAEKERLKQKAKEKLNELFGR